MVSRGHEVELYVFMHTEFTKSLSDFPCPIHCLSINSLLSPTKLLALWNFRKSLLTRNVDVVHGFFNDVALILPPLMIASGIRTYTSRRDMGIWYTSSKLCFLRLFRFAQVKLICNSLAVAKVVHKMEWKQQKSIVVIYNGIDPYFPVEEENLCDWAPQRRDDLGIIKIVLVANVRPVKRIEDLIRAANRLHHGNSRFQFYVVGHISDQLYYDSLQELIYRYQLGGHFHFVGQVAEPRCCLARFDIGVLTSETEGLSNTIMEYLQAGLPVVASRVGGNPELLVDGHNGFLYKVGDDKALADCLNTLADDVNLRQALSAKAKDSMMEFDSKIMIERYEKEYEDLMCKRNEN